MPEVIQEPQTTTLEKTFLVAQPPEHDIHSLLESVGLVDGDPRLHPESIVLIAGPRMIERHPVKKETFHIFPGRLGLGATRDRNFNFVIVYPGAGVKFESRNTRIVFEVNNFEHDEQGGPPYAHVHVSDTHHQRRYNTDVSAKNLIAPLINDVFYQEMGTVVWITPEYVSSNPHPSKTP